MRGPSFRATGLSEYDLRIGKAEKHDSRVGYADSSVAQTSVPETAGNSEKKRVVSSRIAARKCLNVDPERQLSREALGERMERQTKAGRRNWRRSSWSRFW